jgi:hypothetical protein
VGACAFLITLPVLAQSVSGFQNATASVATSGTWRINIPRQQWNFTGYIGATALAPHVNTGSDSDGDYQEIGFDYSIAQGSRSAAIRLYQNRPLVVFSITWKNGGANSAPFPAITSYPNLHSLSFYGMFAPPDFARLLPDSPWAFFDDSGATWMLSPIDNFMTAVSGRGTDGTIVSGISPKITALPPGFTQRTALVYGQGINQTFENWGRALTDTWGKKRPANDDGALLKSISYWTDNGATYYYNPGDTTYTDTLTRIRDEFRSKGIQPGSVQLDSWWYPKGPDNSWSSHMGIWTYTASSSLFPSDLSGFEATLKLPLIAHARWIDAASPYRGQFQISGNVATDPAYWEMVASYLKKSGVTTYEQDWLGQNAEANFDLTSPSAFLGNMASAMAKYGLTVQYCMGFPEHFMESVKYSNVTNIRASQDHFGSTRWTNFFYSSRLASALGLWPFSDVFASSEADNLTAAVLSGGPLGVGDPLGSISGENLLRAVRADGVIVKPDVSATPLDNVFVNDANQVDSPMVAATYTAGSGGIRTWYVFAYPRGANNSLTITPSDLGISGDAWLYEPASDSGRLIAAHSSWTTDLAGGMHYYVLAPVGTSGIAMIGDHGNIVSMGKKRISAFIDNAAGADVTVTFAKGEHIRTLTGYSPKPVSVTTYTGLDSGADWDPTTRMFTVRVRPAGGIAHVVISIASSSAEGIRSGCNRCTAPQPGSPSDQ